MSAPAEPNGGEIDESEPDHAANMPPETECGGNETKSVPAEPPSEAGEHVSETKPVEQDTPAPSVAPILDGLERWLSRNGTPPHK